MVLRQLPAAISRSAALNSTCTSFSASANVDGETAGPVSGAVPKAGGAPGGREVESGVGLRHAAAAAQRAAEERLRKRLRESDMVFCEPILAKEVAEAGTVEDNGRRLSPTRPRTSQSFSAR